MKNIFGLFAVLLSLSLLNACAAPKEINENASAEELYTHAHKLLDKTSYAKAAETFEKVELEHPYSKWATKAKLMGAYAYYKDQKYDDAVMSLDRFIKYHPGNQDAPYAYYLKALCYYEQIVTVDKDQSNTAKAKEAFEQVINRFPDSEYAQDAKLKIDLTNDHLAGKEMEVGRYYLNQKNYLSALNRFSVVVNQYQTTSHIEEALYRQVEIYTILGLNAEARTAAKVLSYNYPDGKWTQKAKNIIGSK
ncbi:MAG: outer membrane protein assembly factor BamD [Alphaproteobacteria bacterium]|nr:outer membrane protein assembly factor BamD [Alphaproteobacteria bacterium]MBQ8631657.1 outer membrane protein assembly factor BamD [Alphaproteobacteria bacterium]